MQIPLSPASVQRVWIARTALCDPTACQEQERQRPFTYQKSLKNTRGCRGGRPPNGNIKKQRNDSNRPVRLIATIQRQKTPTLCFKYWVRRWEKRPASKGGVHPEFTRWRAPTGRTQCHCPDWRRSAAAATGIASSAADTCSPVDRTDTAEPGGGRGLRARRPPRVAAWTARASAGRIHRCAAPVRRSAAASWSWSWARCWTCGRAPRWTRRSDTGSSCTWGMRRWW